MAYVNYVREHMAFIERASDLNLNGNERTLWYALIHIANQRANGSDWPEDFISVPNKRLLALVPFGEKNIPVLRNRLRQAGLIDFRNGERNKRAPEYKILYLTAELSTETPQNAESYRKNDGKIEGNGTGKSVGKGIGNGCGKAVGNGGNLNVNLNDKPKRNINACEEDDERLELTRRAQEAYRTAFGHEPTTAEINRMVNAEINHHMSADMLDEAIKQAAEAHAVHPAMYVLSILSDWRSAFVFSREDLDEYLALKKACDGRDSFLSRDKAMQMELDAFDRRMKEAHVRGLRAIG